MIFLLLPVPAVHAEDAELLCALPDTIAEEAESSEEFDPAALLEELFDFGEEFEPEDPFSHEDEPGELSEAKKALLSIFVATDRHGSSSNLKASLKLAKSGSETDFGTPITATLLGGDMVDGTSSYNLSTVNSEIQSVLGSDFTACYYTYGSHDENAKITGTNGFLVGAVDLGACYIYGVSYDGVGNTSTASKESAAFTAWIATAEKKPVLVMSHMPLHYRRGDNPGASVWITALNAASEDHDILFLWGHNHTGEDSSDTSAYYIAKGGSITPASTSGSGGGGGRKGSSGSSTQAVTIGFTYMNAGYIKNGYGSLISITETEIIVDRYSTSKKTATYTIPRTDEPKKDVTVLIRSAAGEVSGVALLTGGGIYKEGDEVTLTAEKIEGSTFLGWYPEKAEEPLSTENELTLELMEDIALTAVYKAGNALITVECDSYILQQKGKTLTPAEGEVYTTDGGIQTELLYTGFGTFLYWTDEYGNCRSKSPRMRFTSLRGGTYVAVLKEAE